MLGRMTEATARPSPTPPSQSRANVVLGSILLALGILMSILGSILLTAGALAGAVNQLRDAEGYFVTPTETFATDSFAITSPSVGRLTTDGRARTLPFDLATVRLRAASPDGDVFVGVGPRAEIEAYLQDVARTEIRDLRYFPFEVEYRDIPGEGTPAPPTEQDFWAASASGAGTQELEWSVTPGDWGVVVMNADGTAGVTAQLQAGIRSDLIAPVATTLIFTGVLLLVLGIPLLVLGAVLLGRGLARTRPAVTGGAMAPPGAVGAPALAAGAYPARLAGVRDPNLSRWLWLVKWLLAIPHYVILLFLWFAFGVTTVIAGFAILFTGRYPHSLFTFNVGVLRWGWRVGFYTYSALGTDRYPPFSLAPADYPAEFDVPYPERLSRGLVLVKWWLLAIPHYLILAAISGGAYAWRGDWDRDAGRAGWSLLGVLVLIAGVALLFTARYPNGLFNLVMGINRWYFRVVTYAALLRDEYPPFRLDQGPLEPSAAEVHAAEQSPDARM
jgi:hypothetical protein